MSYLIGIICALVFVIYIMIVHFRFPNKQINFIDRALSVLLIVIFLMRFMCFKDAQMVILIILLILHKLKMD